MKEHIDDVLPAVYPESEKTTVLLGSEVSCLAFWKRRVHSTPTLPSGKMPRPYSSVQTVADLRAIDPLRITEILLMPDFGPDFADYAMFCAELSHLDFMYKIPIRSGEAMSS